MVSDPKVQAVIRKGYEEGLTVRRIRILLLAELKVDVAEQDILRCVSTLSSKPN